jgi:hypothetical protein
MQNRGSALGFCFEGFGIGLIIYPHPAMDRDLFVRDFGTNLDPSSVGSPASPELTEAAQSFVRNLETSLRLLSVPRLLILLGVRELGDVGLFMRALTVDDAFLSWPESDQTRREVEARIQGMKREGADDAQQRRTAELNRRIDVLTANPEIDHVLLSLAHAVVSGLWTTVECVARDVWVAAVNSRPTGLGPPVLSSLPPGQEGESISRRSVTVGLLARYGFDLRGHLGTVLAPKFDFTSVSGMRDAFAAAFLGAPEVDRIFASEWLRLLEATRHAIVHTAGRVDAEYLKRTARPVRLGEMLTVSAADLSEYVRAVRDSGSELLQYVDSRLLAGCG